LRVHTTNDNTGSVRKPTRNSAEQCHVVCLVRIINLSLYVRAPILEPDPMIRCKNQRRHGIDLKNPFTMSKSSRPLGR
jgi:hypothetical protein